MAETTLSNRIQETLALFAELPPAPDSDTPEWPLGELFLALRCAERPGDRAEAEDLIWALWCSHPDDDASRRMQKAIGAIARGELDEAETILDGLVRAWPAWAEAWNKRATLYFLQGRDEDSVTDIQHTLRLEPRHFGAVSGLGQICLRAGDELSALIVFEHALTLNPNLENVREVVALLRENVPRTVH